MEWIHGMVFGLSPEILQHIMDKTEMVELRGALLDSFVRHSLPKKTYLDSKSGSGNPHLYCCFDCRSLLQRTARFLLLDCPYTIGFLLLCSSFSSWTTCLFRVHIFSLSPFFEFLCLSLIPSCTVW
ncbi:unnamed protein product [Gongylonema pulchrum]|uniref:Zf-RVT domain-containing protein n=1 Tax=Gongylonema pulchrum TaxID=637853 RepID=A0A183DUJ3_9BILA|nr:unnamed protein product [Gongylonema pulchrum]